MNLDDLPFDYGDPEPTPNGATGRTKCRRHRWSVQWSDETLPNTLEQPLRFCRNCGASWDLQRSRRGKSNLRAGKDAERAIAKAYGGKRTGQYGGPDDVVVGDLFIVQSKCGRTWFRQPYVDELDKLPRTGGRVPTLIVSSRPGPGRATRRYVVRLLEDDVALHGEKP